MTPRLPCFAAALSAVMIGLSALPVTGALAQRASLPDIEDEVMCLICGTVLEASESPQAERERALIRTLIDEGRTKEEIKDALVDEYGPEVLATPEGDGFDVAAWAVPGLGLLAGAAAIALHLRRRGVDGPRDPAPEPATEADTRRLEDDLRRFDP